MCATKLDKQELFQAQQARRFFAKDTSIEEEIAKRNRFKKLVARVLKRAK